MDNEILDRIEKAGYSLGERTTKDVDFLIDLFKTKVEEYRKSRGENERIFSKLGIHPDNLDPQSRTILSDLTTLKKATGSISIDICDVGIVVLDTLQKKYDNEYIIHGLEDHITKLCQRNDSVKKETETVEEEIKLTSKQIENVGCLPNSNINSLKTLVKSYEEKVAVIVENNSWIDKPEYNTASILNEMRQLQKLSCEAEKLQAEKDVYQGLQPDLYAARNQLAAVKADYESLKSNTKK